MWRERTPAPRLWIAALAGLWVGGQAGMLPAQEPTETISAEAQAAMRLIESEDAYQQQQGFLLLEALREPATAPVIRRFLDDRSPDIRRFSVRALAAVEGASAVPVLQDALDDDSAEVRLAALLALEPLRDDTVVPLLVERLQDRSPEVRMAAADIVSRIESPGAQEAILRRWRKERDHDVRRVLKLALARMGLEEPPR